MVLDEELPDGIEEFQLVNVTHSGVKTMADALESKTLCISMEAASVRAPRQRMSRAGGAGSHRTAETHTRM
jgi:hypothetical protein